jgi:uncharacterized protein affecting Mg2+/Co2+ transport
MSGKYNIVAEQGATFNLNFRVETDGTPWNLTGYTFAMQVRRSAAATTTLLNITSATMTSQGHVSVTVSATTMSDVPAGRWVYDIELTSSGNEVTRILEGRFIVTAEVTQ